MIQASARAFTEVQAFERTVVAIVPMGTGTGGPNFDLGINAFWEDEPWRPSWAVISRPF
jgi:hypothetical protein